MKPKKISIKSYEDFKKNLKKNDLIEFPNGRLEMILDCYIYRLLHGNTKIRTFNPEEKSIREYHYKKNNSVINIEPFFKRYASRRTMKQFNRYDKIFYDVLEHIKENS